MLHKISVVARIVTENYKKEIWFLISLTKKPREQSIFLGEYLRVSSVK